MRTSFRAAALALLLAAGLAGCSFTIDPGSVKPPSGQPPVCTPACAGKACGNSDGCGATCQPGSGCQSGGVTHTVEGGPTLGAADSTGQSHRVRGAVTTGAAADLSNANHRIEQGTLR